MTSAAPTSSRALRLLPRRVSATGVAPIIRAIWIAAMPTLLEAAGMSSVSLAFSPAISMSAP